MSQWEKGEQGRQDSPPPDDPPGPVGFTHLHGVDRKDTHGLSHYQDGIGETRPFDHLLFLFIVQPKRPRGV